MVVSLFETGYLRSGAGLFEYDRGHLSADEGMAVRLADAMFRGAKCGVDLLAVDWFEHASTPLAEVRAALNIVPKSAAAIAAGSVGPWDPAGISPFQKAAAEHARADREARGATERARLR
jgi:hypothetical protein